MTKASLTFISLLLILVLSGCVTSPAIKNISQNNSDNKSYISSIINEDAVVKVSKLEEVTTTLNDLFFFKNLDDQKISSINLYIKNSLLSEEGVSRVSSFLSINQKIKKAGIIELNYITSDENKEYIIESVLQDNSKFNVQFDKLDGKRIKNNLLTSNLLYFCKSIIEEQKELIEDSIFSSKKDGDKVVVVYSKDFQEQARLLKQKYPAIRLSMVEGNFEEFTKETLGIDDSLKRFGAIELLDKNIRLENNPRERKDFSDIYFLLTHEVGKSIVPIFRSYLLDIKFFSTSEIILSATNINQLNDFEGMFIPSPDYFFKKIVDKKEIRSFDDEYRKALISDLLLAEKLMQSNVSKASIFLNTGSAVFNRNECIKREIPIWKISLNNFY